MLRRLRVECKKKRAHVGLYSPRSPYWVIVRPVVVQQWPVLIEKRDGWGPWGECRGKHGKEKDIYWSSKAALTENE